MLLKLVFFASYLMNRLDVKQLLHEKDRDEYFLNKFAGLGLKSKNVNKAYV